MADIPDNTVLRIVVSILLPDNVLAQNIFYTLFRDTGASADADDVVSDIVDYVETMYDEVASQINALAASAGIHVYNYDAGDDDWDEVGSTTWVDTFAGGGDMLPHGAAAVLHAKTTDPDVQATKFLPGLQEVQSAGSDLIAGAITAYTAFVVDWIQDDVGTATGGDFEMGVWSPKNSAFFHFNNIGIVNHIIGYQRRRKPGVGI